MARGGDPIPKDLIDYTTGKSQQTSQGPISGLFPPFSEQMKNEE
jgi:hypothetical protein